MGAILFSLEHSLYSHIIKSSDPHQVRVDGRQVLLFMMLCAIMKIFRGFGLLKPSSLLETRYLVFVFLQLVSCFLLFGMCQWISHSLRYLLIYILQVIGFRLVCYYHLIPCLLVYYQLCVELILESLEHAYLATIYNFFCLLSFFDPIYRGNSTLS